MSTDVGLLAYYHVGFLGRRAKGKTWGRGFEEAVFDIILDPSVLNTVKPFYNTSSYF